MDPLIHLDVIEPLSHVGMLDDRDDCPHSSINPALNKGTDDQVSYEGAIRILRPLVKSLLNWSNNKQGLKERLQHVDEAMKMVVQDLEQQPVADTAVVLQSVSVSSKFKSIAEDIDEFLLSCTKISRPFTSSTWKGPKHTTHFLDSVKQILQDIYDHEAETIGMFNIHAKKEILDVYDQLKFVENLRLLIILVAQTMKPRKCRYLLCVTENIAIEISRLLCKSLVNKMDDAELVRCLKESICGLRKSYHELTYQHLRLANYVDTTKLDEHVVDFFDYLIEEMRKLLSHNGASFMVAADVNVIEILVDELNFLRCNLLDVLTLYQQDQEVLVMEKMKYLCFSTQILIVDTGFLYLSRLDDKGKKEKERANYWDLQLPSSLEAHVGFPKQRASYLSPTEKEKDEKDTANHWRIHLPGLLQQVDSLKQQASDLFSVSNRFLSLSTKSSISKNQMGSCTSFLIKNLEELMHSDATNSFEPLSHQIQTIYQETLSLRTCLAEIIAENQLVNSQSQIKFLRQQFEEAANKSSFIIDSIVAGEGPLWYHKLGMFLVQNHINLGQREMKAYLRKKIAFDTISPSFSCLASSSGKNAIQTFSEVGSQDSRMDTKMEESLDKLVGVTDAATKVTELLISTGATKLKTVAIVGMPGLGKTTLANSVYKHPSIVARFHLRAWCCASQSYVKEALLFEIWNQIVSRTSERCEVRGDDLAPKIRQNLKGRKYLIVIDDVWDVQLWYDLKGTFPDDHNRSRILFTTRNRFALENNSIPYALRLLSSEESRELLLFKVFDQENCPPELLLISNNIAKNCKGLPLAVVLVAGILKRTERRKDLWEQVAKTVFNLHGKYRDKMDVSDILEFSYKHLPDCLKPCFNYFGAFPEDTSISVSRLTRLWISQGFAQGLNLSEKSLKQEAEDYLRDLIDRSLVMIAKTSSKGGVKACRVHDVIHEFCLGKLDAERKVLKEDLLNAGSSYHSSLNNMRWTTYLYHCRSNVGPTVPGHFDFQKVSRGIPSRGLHSATNVSWDKPPTVGMGLSHSGLARGNPRSEFSWDKPPTVGVGLSHSGLARGNARSENFETSRNIYQLVSKFQLLGVLDLGNVGVERSADTADIVMIAKLVHLRYLAIRPRRNEIPTEIGNLRNLETFVLSGVIGDIILPESVWDLVSLRHLLSEHGFFNFPGCSEQFFQTFTQLDNLNSICTLPLQHGNNVEDFLLRRLPSIEKLGCRVFPNSTTGCSIFPELEFLSELKSLKIFFSGNVLCPFKCSLPSNLVKLALSNSRLPWQEISAIGQLPNLEILKLLSRAFEGQQWDMRDDEFPKLKFLKLESLDIQLWNAFAHHLPLLEQLVVQHCPKLKEIPSSMGEIATLKFIGMKWCSSSAMDSVKQVLKFQREMSNDELNVTLVSPA